MDILAEQTRVTWDELKANLASKSTREEGVPGSNEFDSFSAKLEKERNERLQVQEMETKKMLKTVNKGRGHKDKKKDKKDKKDKSKGPKRTADGAVFAQSSDDDEPSDEDLLLKRYKTAS